MAGPQLRVSSPPSPCRLLGKPYQFSQLSCLSFLTYKVAIMAVPSSLGGTRSLSTCWGQALPWARGHTAVGEADQASALMGRACSSEFGEGTNKEYAQSS